MQDTTEQQVADRTKPALAEGFLVAGRQVEPELNRIDTGAGAVQVEPKVMQVLVCLARQPGQVLSRDQLNDAVWPDAVVGDDLLTRCISELRKLFDDDPRHPRVIETIRKRGYRLIAPVQPNSLLDRPPANGAADSLSTRPSEAFWGRRSFSQVLWIVGLAVVVGVGGVAGYRLLRAPAPASFSVSGATPLTTFPGQERDAAFSSDGTRVAFVWNSTREGRYDLYVRLVEAGEPLQLTNTPEAWERSPAWSPDGLTLAFVRYQGDRCAIYALPALGGAERKLTDCGAGNEDLLWTPDGSGLVFSERASAEGPFRIVYFDLETRQRRPLTQPPAYHRGDRDPVFSPDGQTLAFTRDVNGWVGHLFVMPAGGGDAGGGDARQVTFDNRDLVGHDWRPDGSGLVFSSNLGGEYSLWEVRLDGGSPRWLNAPGLKLKHPTLARNDGALAYESWTHDINVWHLPLADAEAAEPTRLIASTLWDIHPTFSPDGRRIAFTSTRSGHFEIWVCDRVGARAEQVTTLAGPFVGTPHWAPDNRRLVFDARPDGHADLFTVDTETRLAERLTTDGYNDLTPRWSRDGRWMYFVSDRSGTWQIWKRRAAGGEPVQVTQNGGFAVEEAPDGTALYFTKPGERELWHVPVTGGEEAQVFDAFPAIAPGFWAVAEDGIYFIDVANPPGFRLVRLNIETGRTSLVKRLDHLSDPPTLSVSRDGRSALLTILERSESDLMYVASME